MVRGRIRLRVRLRVRARSASVEHLGLVLGLGLGLGVGLGLGLGIAEHLGLVCRVVEGRLPASRRLEGRRLRRRLLTLRLRA